MSIQIVPAIAATMIWPLELQAQHRFRVNSTVDAVDALPGDGICATVTGECTLRAAVQETNALEGCDIIRLPAGQFNFAIPGANEDAAATGDLDILDHVTILGAGADQTIISAGTGRDRTFHVSPSGTPIEVEMKDLAVSDASVPFTSGVGFSNNGHLRLLRTVIARNRGDRLGTGIFNTGTLIVRHSELIANDALLGSSGGAIYNLGVASLSLSRVIGNTAARGAGIFNAERGTVSVDDTTIAANNGGGGGSGSGAGLHNDGVLHVRRTTISGNVGSDFVNGIGIHNAGSLTVVNSTISGNRASFGLGGDCTTQGASRCSPRRCPTIAPRQPSSRRREELSLRVEQSRCHTQSWPPTASSPPLRVREAFSTAAAWQERSSRTATTSSAAIRAVPPMASVIK